MSLKAMYIQEQFQDEYSGFEEGEVYEADHLNYSDISDVQVFISKTFKLHCVFLH